MSSTDAAGAGPAKFPRRAVAMKLEVVGADQGTASGPLTTEEDSPMDVATLAEPLHETAEHHGVYMEGVLGASGGSESS